MLIVDVDIVTAASYTITSKVVELDSEGVSLRAAFNVIT